MNMRTTLIAVAALLLGYLLGSLYSPSGMYATNKISWDNATLRKEVQLLKELVAAMEQERSEGKVSEASGKAEEKVSGETQK